MSHPVTPTTTPISQLVESNLRNADGHYLGRIDELLIDLRSGRIAYVVAEVPDGRRVRFPWHAITFSRGGFIAHQRDLRLVPSGPSPTT